MGYDAVGLSARDLQAGKDFFQNLQQNSELVSPFPFVSCNVVTTNQLPVFSPFIIKKLHGVNIGIIGLTGGSTAPLKDFIVTDWKDALQKQLPVVSQQAEFLLLLSSLDMKDNEELSRLFPEIDLIISTSSNYGNTTKIINQALLAQVAGEGSMLGELKINWSQQAKEGWQELEAVSTEELEKLLAASTRRLNTLQQAAAEATDAQQQRRLHVRSRQESRQKSVLSSRLEHIATTEKLLEQNKIQSFTVRFRKIYPKPGSQQIIKLVEKIKEAQHQAEIAGDK